MCVQHLFLKKQLSENNFINLSRLWIEEILSHDHFNAILSSDNAYFLVAALIHLKKGNALTAENTSFIFSYKTLLACPLACILLYLDQQQLNTPENRSHLRRSSDRLIPLLYAIELLIKAECFTQENFELIQADDKKDWLYTLWVVPVDLIDDEVWRRLVNLSITSNKKEFKKDIEAYIQILKFEKNKRIEMPWHPSKSEINGHSRFFSFSEENLIQLNEYSDIQTSWLSQAC